MNVQWNAEIQNQNCWDRGNRSYDGKYNGVRAELSKGMFRNFSGRWWVVWTGARKIAAYISRVCRCRAKEVNRHRHDDESKTKAQAVRQISSFSTTTTVLLWRRAAYTKSWKLSRSRAESRRQLLPPREQLYPIDFHSTPKIYTWLFFQRG